MRIKFIGTGSVSSLSNSSSMLINDDILLDCGNGIYKALLNNNVDITKIHYIVITHLHGDHVFDIPFLLFGIAKKNPGQKITFIGNKYLKRKVLCLMREAHILSWMNLYNSIDINYIKSSFLNEKLLNNDITISSFKVIHGKLKQCYGYIFNNKLAFTGDSSYCNSVKIVATNIEYLVPDCTKKIGDSSHMGIDNIKELAKNKKLKIITTHMGVASKEKLKKTIFRNNNVIIANDGEVFYIN